MFITSTLNYFHIIIQTSVLVDRFLIIWDLYGGCCCSFDIYKFHCSLSYRTVTVYAYICMNE